MALIDRIPMPGTGMEGMQQGADWMSKLLMAPVEMRYKDAIAKWQSAQADQARKRMWALSQLPGMGGAGGAGEQPSQDYQPVETVPQGTEMGESNRASDAMVNDIATHGNQAYNQPARAQGQQPVSVAPIYDDQQMGQIADQYLKSPEAQADAQKTGKYTVPSKEGLIKWAQEQRSKQQDPSQAQRALALTQLAGMKGYQADGNIVTPFGTTKVGPSAFEKGLQKEDIKQTGEWNKAITAGQAIQPSIDIMQSVMANPVWEGMKQHPELLGHDMKWYSRMGTPEQQDLIGKFYGAQKDAVQAYVTAYKGAAKESEINLGLKALPNDTDPIHLMVAKANTLAALKKVSADRLSLADTIYRQSNGQVSPSKALEMATNAIKTDQVVKKIENQFEQEKNKYGTSEDQMQKWADEAIKQGAPRDVVMKKLSEMRNQKG